MKNKGRALLYMCSIIGMLCTIKVMVKLREEKKRVERHYFKGGTPIDAQVMPLGIKDIFINYEEAIAKIPLRMLFILYGGKQHILEVSGNLVFDSWDNCNNCVCAHTVAYGEDYEIHFDKKDNIMMIKIMGED